MACIDSDGTLSPSAVALLKISHAPMTPEEIAAHLSQPLFKVRGSIREMTNAGLLSQDGDKYVITDQGKTKI